MRVGAAVGAAEPCSSTSTLPLAGTRVETRYACPIGQPRVRADQVQSRSQRVFGLCGFVGGGRHLLQEIDQAGVQHEGVLGLEGLVPRQREVPRALFNASFERHLRVEQGAIGGLHGEEGAIEACVVVPQQQIDDGGKQRDEQHHHRGDDADGHDFLNVERVLAQGNQAGEDGDDGRQDDEPAQRAGCRGMAARE